MANAKGAAIANANNNPGATNSFGSATPYQQNGQWYDPNGNPITAEQAQSTLSQVSQQDAANQAAIGTFNQQTNHATGLLDFLGNSDAASNFRSLISGYGTVPGLTDTGEGAPGTDYLDPTKSAFAGQGSSASANEFGSEVGRAGEVPRAVESGFPAIRDQFDYFKHAYLDKANVVGDPGNVGGILKDNGLGGIVTTDYKPGFFGGIKGPGSAPGSDGSVGGVGGTGGGSSGSGGGSGAPGSLQDIANQAYQQGQQQRDWLMGQNAQAQGYFQPAQNAYAGLFGPGGQLSGPGTGEQAFSAMGQSILGPTAIGQYQQQTAGELGQQGQGENAYAYMMQNGLGQPGQFEQGANAYRGALAQPGAASTYQQGAAGQVGTPGQFEQQSGAYQGALAQTSNAQTAYGQMAGGYQAPTALEQAYGGLMGGYKQPGQLQQQTGALAGQLSQPGQLEQFAAKDAAGNNPYFDQLRQTTNAALDQEFNAGGNFNSGARMAALGRADSNLAAQQYQQEAQLQGQAQTATGQRLGQLQDLYGASDQQGLQRLGAQAGLAGDVSGQSLNYLNSGLSAAGNVDATNTSRLTAGANISQGAESSALQRLGLGGQLAQNADQSSYQRLLAGSNILGQQQSDQMQRLGMVGQYGNDAQSQMLARLGLGGNLAGAATNAGFTQYQDYLNQALAAQGAGQTRGQLGFADAFGLGGQQAQLQQGFATDANDAYAQMVSAALGAQTNALSLQQQKAMADKNAKYGLYGALIGALA